MYYNVLYFIHILIIDAKIISIDYRYKIYKLHITMFITYYRLIKTGRWEMMGVMAPGLVACVSDSFDVFKACREYWGDALKDKIKGRISPSLSCEVPGQNGSKCKIKIFVFIYNI